MKGSSRHEGSVFKGAVEYLSEEVVVENLSNEALGMSRHEDFGFTCQVEIKR